MSALSTVVARGTNGARPAAGNTGRLYYDTTNSQLQRDNGSSWDVCEPSALTNPMTTEGDIIYGGASGVATRKAVGTAAYGLVSDGTDPVWAEILPWHILINPMACTPDATTGTWLIGGGASDSALFYPYYVPGSVANSGSGANMSNGTAVAQNDAISYDIVLAKGTWDAHFWVRKSTNTGIITLKQDTVSQGTVDTYAAAAAAAKVSITGWTVASTGKHTFQLIMATKNASSSNYILQLFAIEFRRTA